MRELRGLYAIADTAILPDHRFAAAIRAVVDGGAVMVQYRDKSRAARRRRRQADELVRLCGEAGVVSIINDDIDLAIATGADGVHLGADDREPADARRQLGAHAIMGVSCYDSLDRALAAADAGADYLAFGRVFPSTTKPGGPRAGLELLATARERTGLPVCAIGGITLDRVAPVIAAGVDLVAVISDLFGAGDEGDRARAYRRAFER